LLHLVGYLYYWQMGFNSVFKGLNPGGAGRDFPQPSTLALGPTQWIPGLSRG
jgi:hypothetical protein